MKAEGMDNDDDGDDIIVPAGDEYYEGYYEFDDGEEPIWYPEGRYVYHEEDDEWYLVEDDGTEWEMQIYEDDEEG